MRKVNKPYVVGERIRENQRMINSMNRERLRELKEIDGMLQPDQDPESKADLGRTEYKTSLLGGEIFKKKETP